MSVIVTHLEMTSSADLRGKPSPDPDFRIEEARLKQWPINRFFYTWIGAAWLWTDKLPWTEDAWKTYAERDRLHTYIATLRGSPVGYFELEETNDAVDIAILGLAPGTEGLGLGGHLLSEAIRHAWLLQPQRVTVNTCTLDHPHALKNYLARGMTIVRVETKGK